MQTWRLIDSGPADAAMNMAIDEAVASACRQGESPTTLRFYTWRPAALSIGYFQNTAREVNLAECQNQGYGFVRRPTGGRAVLHNQELTYSVSSRADNRIFPKDLHGVFLVIARALTGGLGHLGIQAQVFEETPGRKPRPSEIKRAHADRAQLSPACFATAMGFEIGHEGKKLIGSAQRRWKDGFLQHGSILLGFEPEVLFRLLNFPDERKREMAINHASQAVTSLSAIMQRKVDLSRLKECLVKGFEESLDLQFVPARLSSFESELAQTLFQKKYGSREWNIQRPF